MINHRFKLLMIPTLMAVLFIGGSTLLCQLGFWQLSRAKQKEAWLHDAQEAQHKATLEQNDLLALSQPHEYRFHPVSLKGKFINEHTILLDNKTKDHQVGYHVYVPMALNNSTWILINRGFVPQGRRRSDIPMLEPIKGEVSIKGYLNVSHRNPFIRSESGSEVTWPYLVQQLDLSFLSHVLQHTLYPLFIELDESGAPAIGSLSKSMGLPPERHRGYAFQWFLLALTLLICPSVYWMVNRKK